MLGAPGKMQSEPLHSGSTFSALRLASLSHLPPIALHALVLSGLLGRVTRGVFVRLDSLGLSRTSVYRHLTWPASSATACQRERSVYHVPRC